MSEEQDPQPLTLQHRMIAAGGASVLSVFITNPLDVIKTRLQTVQHYKHAFPKKSMNCWLLRKIPAATDQFRNALLGLRHAVCNRPRPAPGERPGGYLSGTCVTFAPLSASCNINASSCACICLTRNKQALATAPSLHYRAHQSVPMSVLELKSAAEGEAYQLRTSFKKAVEGNILVSGGKGAAERAEVSAFGMFREILNKEGVRAFWRGTPVSLLSSIPMVAIYMPLYDHLLADVFRPLLDSDSNILGGFGIQGISLAPVMAGMVARTASVCVVAPLDLLRTRQHSTAAGSAGSLFSAAVVGSSYAGEGAGMERKVPNTTASPYSGTSQTTSMGCVPYGDGIARGPGAASSSATANALSVRQMHLAGDMRAGPYAAVFRRGPAAFRPSAYAVESSGGGGGGVSGGSVAMPRPASIPAVPYSRVHLSACSAGLPQARTPERVTSVVSPSLRSLLEFSEAAGNQKPWVRSLRQTGVAAGLAAGGIPSPVAAPLLSASGTGHVSPTALDFRSSMASRALRALPPSAFIWNMPWLPVLAAESSSSPRAPSPSSALASNAPPNSKPSSSNARTCPSSEFFRGEPHRQRHQHVQHASLSEPATPLSLSSSSSSSSSSSTWTTRLRRLPSLWTGVGATLARDVPFSAIYWALLETGKGVLTKQVISSRSESVSQDHTSSGGATHADVSSQHVTGSSTASATEAQAAPRLQRSELVWVNALSGAAAGVVAAGVTVPLDVVKTRRQVAPLSGSGGSTGLVSGNVRGNSDEGVASALREIVRREGWRGLFRGAGPRMVRAAPACAIVITSYEVLKDAIAEDWLPVQS